MSVVATGTSGRDNLKPQNQSNHAKALRTHNAASMVTPHNIAHAQPAAEPEPSTPNIDGPPPPMCDACSALDLRIPRGYLFRDALGSAAAAIRAGNATVPELVSWLSKEYASVLSDIGDPDMVSPAGPSFFCSA